MPRPFARVARADQLPGHCIRCPRKEDLVDLGAEGIPNYGVPYLCTVCLNDLLGQMGVVARDVHEDSLASLQRELRAAEEQIIALRQNANADFIADQFKEFSHDVNALARRLVDRLADGPARPAGGDLARRVDDAPIGPADGDADADDAVGVGSGEAEGAGAGAGDDVEVAERDVFAALGLGGGGAAGDPADGAGDDPWDIAGDPRAGEDD